MWGGEATHVIFGAFDLQKRDSLLFKTKHSSKKINQHVEDNDNELYSRD